VTVDKTISRRLFVISHTNEGSLAVGIFVFVKRSVFGCFQKGPKKLQTKKK